MTTGILRQLKKNRHAYVIALLGFLVSLGLFYALQIQEERYILNLAQLGIETIDTHIQAELNFNAHILKHVADQTLRVDDQPAKVRSLVTDLLTTYPQILALLEVNYNNKINWIQTKKEASVYKNVVGPFLQANSGSLLSRHSLWVSSPLNLPDKKIALFMVLPYSAPGAQKNPAASHYFIALLDCRYLIHRNAQLPGMVFKVYLNLQPITPSEANSHDQHWLFGVSKTLYSALWQIRAQEVTINLGIIHLISKEAPLSWMTFILGILISILLARSTALSDLLKERTIVLDQINQDLKSEITNHIQTEASKKNLEKALLQGQKLQAIGTLAGGIAHDFNNILYAIRGYIELAREEIPKDEITYKNLGKVLEATYRGQDLISQILTFSRRQQHHEFIPLSLKTEITGALALLRSTVPQSVELDFHAATEGKIMGNKTQIHQIIVNLINNAVDAMDGEGKIDLTLSQIPATEIQGLKISPLKLNNYCRIEVKDTGHGMDQSTMDRVFEPFFTTKEVGKGTGLGLSTVHSIVKDHLGEILVNSQIGKGSTFTIYFPEQEPLKEDQTHG